MDRPKDPLLWGLFSAGGTLAALVLPALVLVAFLAAPLGWLGPADFGAWMEVVGHPLIRLVLFGIVALSLHHAAHRLRYTLYDGLQLYHLDALITVLTYGIATALALTAAVLLWMVG